MSEDTRSTPASVPVPPARRRLGRNYWRLLSASTAANLGDGLMTVAVVWLASSLTREASLIALVALATRLPWLLFALPAGVITDRIDRRLLVAWADAARFAVVAAFGAALLLHQDGLPTPAELAAGAPPPGNAGWLLAALCGVALLLGSAEVLRDNAAQTLLPSVVDKRDLEKANSRMWGAETATNNFIGPPLGGLLVAAALALPFFLNAGLLAVSALLVFTLAGSFAPAAGARTGRISWRAEIAEGMRWLWRHRLLRTLALLLAAMNALGAMAMVVLVLFVQDVLNLYQGWQFGLVTTGFAVGAVAGSAIADRVAARLTPGTAMLTSIAGTGAALCVLSTISSAVLFWATGVVSGFLMILWNVVSVSLRQRLIPDRLLGRGNSVYRFFGWGTLSLGAALGGVLVTAGEPWLGREGALRMPFLLAGLAHLALLAYALPRINSARVAAAEARAVEG
ncbi:MFS transporter [Streptomyces sp. ST2-7A]|uniref:MFS transporter n=1 Tax=Streptomyces sp. ST2-7A TaxID=2907214 RepID=UPI001F38B20E|nr:MFS transporter [Streptomyces sp. ST2-7A]MCE7080992.1 MFS transporter [Streptomyces sp. ST2-7A]